MANIKISQLAQFTSSPRNTWLVMNNSAQTETFKITRETLLSGLIQCSDVIASESLQSNEFFPADDVDLNISTRINSGTKGINLMTGPKPGGLGYVRMKITSGGTIGVNTESPTALFDISSPTGTTVGLRVSGNSSTDMVRITQVGTGHTLVVEDSQNPDSTPFVIRNDGKVYMGTYTEDTTSILNVGGNAHFFGNVYFNGSANVAIQNSVPGRTLINFASVGNSYFNNGNLGVGTILPEARLDVTSPTGSTIGLRVSGNSSTDMVRITQTGSGNALIVEDSSNPDSTPFVITSGGTVGIGTTNPNPFTLNESDGKLHVRNGDSGVTGGTGGSTVVIDANTTNYLSMYSPDENLTGIVFGSPSDAFGSFMRWSHNQGKLEISTANTNDYIELGVGNNNVKAYLSNNGFGVNTLPSQALHISGNTLIEGNIIYPSPSTPPVSSGSTGTKGTVTWDGSYLYICVDTNTWKRTQLLSW
jgi:hypothetical protein